MCAVLYVVKCALMNGEIWRILNDTRGLNTDSTQGIKYRQYSILYYPVKQILLLYYAF
jgi:hypothetical protein